MPALAQAPSTRQRLFIRYFTGALIDLAVLGLFAEYWHWVEVNSFTIILLAAVLLQVLLKLTIMVEHQVARLFKAKSGWLMTVGRFFFAWVVLFGSKFVILEALAVSFGDKLHFGGPFHGIVALIVVVVVMLIAEELVVRLVRKLN